MGGERTDGSADTVHVVHNRREVLMEAAPVYWHYTPSSSLLSPPLLLPSHLISPPPPPCNAADAGKKKLYI